MIISMWIWSNCYKNNSVKFFKDLMYDFFPSITRMIKCLGAEKQTKDMQLLKDKILKYVVDTDSFVEEKRFIQKNEIRVFNYEFTKKYDAKKVIIYLDDDGRPYVLHDTKKLYFKKSMSPREICEYYNGILMEQDEKSPHNYHTKDIFQQYQIQSVADIGAAEGFWGLECIDKIEELYIFECDQEWIEALEKTFENYDGKVKIIKKYVSNQDDSQNVTLDTFFMLKKIDALKADIEGAEMDMLHGGVNTIANLKTARICTYHRKNDADEIYAFMSKLGFHNHFTERHMLFIYDRNLEEPYFRKGVLISEK